MLSRAEELLAIEKFAATRGITHLPEADPIERFIIMTRAERGKRTKSRMDREPQRKETWVKAKRAGQHKQVGGS